MNVVEQIAQLRKTLNAARAAGQSVGFVPTMGALHAGHLSLCERARRECDVVVVSIFVNPAQFGPHEDLDAYPRTLDADLESCEAAGVDAVFCPAGSEMYPEPPLTRVSVSRLAEPLDGLHRPGHFDGVALVVTKLLSIVGECRAYFGDKDAQQLRVVRRMAADLNLPAEIIGCPTVREPDGLAMSSRNAYLSPEERERALALSRALFAIREAAGRGEARTAALVELGMDVLRAGRPDRIDYLDCVDPETLETLEVVEGEALVCGAIRLGGTRLIDNVSVAVKPVPAEEKGRE